MGGGGERREEVEEWRSHLQAGVLLDQLLLGKQVLGFDVFQTGGPLFTLVHANHTTTQHSRGSESCSPHTGQGTVPVGAMVIKTGL